VTPKVDPAAQRAALQHLAQLELAGTNFYEFVKYMWPVLHPATPLVEGPHLLVVCEAIDHQLRGDPAYQRLMLLIPPGFSKSVLASVMRPAWVWLHWASRSSTYVSCMETLAERDSRKTRLLLQSEEYRALQQHLSGAPPGAPPGTGTPRAPCLVCGQVKHPIWTFAEDQNVKINFENTLRGVRQCIGINSKAIGRRGDDILFDDILDAQEVREASAPRLLEILTSVDDQASYFESTRVNNLRTATITLIMQRLCYGDPAARRIAEGGWKVICLPIQYDADHPNVCPEDWRRTPGEWLHPQRFGPVEAAYVKRKLGDEHYATQYEMRARPKQGNLVKQTWVERYYFETPASIKASADEVVLVIDSAVKGAASNDPVSMACWARIGNRKYLIDLVNERMGWLSLKRRTRAFIDQHPEARVKIIEDKASGSQLAEELKDEGVSGVVLFNPGVKDKMTRFKMWATPDLEAGDVLLPQPEHHPWVRGYQARMVALRPNGSDDDDADTTAMVLHRWASDRTAPTIERVEGHPVLRAGPVVRWQRRDALGAYRMGVWADWSIGTATATWAIVVDHDSGIEVARVAVTESGEGAAVVAVAEEAVYWNAVVRVGSARAGMAYRFARELARRKARVAGKDGKYLSTDGEKCVWGPKHALNLWAALERAGREKSIRLRSPDVESDLAAGDMGGVPQASVAALALASTGAREAPPKPAGGPRLTILRPTSSAGDTWSQTATNRLNR
jgi:predicted phage terminase large subunit-like protein